jgi:hypothetical protein
MSRWRAIAMTKRKPPGTNWESWIEGQIRIAREQGAFNNLPGAGKPLPDLGQGDELLRWVRQLAKREQISILPPSLELLRKVEEELAAIEKLPDEATVRLRVAALNVEIAKVNATVIEGPPTRLSTLNVDKVVARWRQTRPANPSSSSPVSPAVQSDDDVKPSRIWQKWLSRRGSRLKWNWFNDLLKRHPLPAARIVRGPLLRTTLVPARFLCCS